MTQENIDMAVDTVAADLIGALMGELKLMPDIWPKIGPDEQDEIIDRVRNRVTDNVRTAVKLIASAGRITVAGDLKKVTFADKVEAVFSLSKHDPATLELCEAQGLACLIVVADASRHMAGADKEAADRQLTIPGVDGEEADGAASAILEQLRRRTQGNPPGHDDGDSAAEAE